MQACTYTRMDTKNVYICVYVYTRYSVYMYIDNTFISLHLVATNSDANVTVTMKRK